MLYNIIQPSDKRSDGYNTIYKKKKTPDVTNYIILWYWITSQYWILCRYFIILIYNIIIYEINIYHK